MNHTPDFEASGVGLPTSTPSSQGRGVFQGWEGNNEMCLKKVEIKNHYPIHGVASSSITTMLYRPYRLPVSIILNLNRADAFQSFCQINLLNPRINSIIPRSTSISTPWSWSTWSWCFHHTTRSLGKMGKNE